MRNRWAVISVVLVVSVLTTGIVGGTAIVDLDGDGEPALFEFGEGSDPLKSDTDGDGLDDSEEKKFGTDPADEDTDNDNLNDGEEVNEYGSDPLESDTDGDGLADPTEVMQYGTDPAAADSDSDGLDDATEVEDTRQILQPQTRTMMDSETVPKSTSMAPIRQRRIPTAMGSKTARKYTNTGATQQTPRVISTGLPTAWK